LAAGVTLTLAALVCLFFISAALCIWAALTGRPNSAPAPRHASWGDGRTELLIDAEDDPTRVIRLDVPSRRWYDENPWPYGRPHGWGETRD
jgi:hypothetical protein